MIRISANAVRLKLLAVCLAIFVAGCSSRVPSTIYDLSVTPRSGIVASYSSAQILIPIPRSVHALNTANIAVFSIGNQISYFTDAKWSDDLPILVQAKLVEAIEHTGGNIAVGVPSDRMLADYRVVTEIRTFHFDVVGERRADVAIVAKIVDESTGKILDSKQFESQLGVLSSNSSDVVAALNEAANEVLNEVAIWTLQRID